MTSSWLSWLVRDQGPLLPQIRMTEVQEVTLSLSSILSKQTLMAHKKVDVLILWILQEVRESPRQVPLAKHWKKPRRLIFLWHHLESVLRLWQTEVLTCLSVIPSLPSSSKMLLVETQRPLWFALQASSSDTWRSLSRLSSSQQELRKSKTRLLLMWCSLQKRCSRWLKDLKQK